MTKYFIAAAMLAIAATAQAQVNQGCDDVRKRSGIAVGELLSDEKLKLMRERVAADKNRGDIASALMSICGIGISKNIDEGVDLLEKAHALGNTNAAAMLVYFYSGNLGAELDTPKLLAWLRIGADDGRPELQSALALASIDGTWTKKDDIAGERLLLRAAAQGFSKAYTQLGWFYFSKQMYKQSLAWFETGSVLGDTDAQVGLGALHAGGFGTPRDHAKALALWSTAADKKSAAAQFAMGTLYANGWGVDHDDAKAVAWFQLAANQGFAGAQAALVHAYDFGIGVALDTSAARSWQKKADQSARAAAQNKAFRMYPDCCDGASDQAMADAIKSYQLDAEGGTADAQLVFARFLLNNKKTQDAVVWYERAAAQGQAQAMAELGAVYLAGYGQPASPELGLKFTRLAAEQGIASARMRLADIYQRGIFVHQSLVAAYALYFNATPQGQETGRLLNNYHSPIDELMSETDISRAKQLARAMATPGNFLAALDNASAH